MAKKGDMLYAWTTNADLAKKAECGGAVTGLLAYALETKMVDAVLAVKRGVDLYDAVPTIITDPKDISKTARLTSLRDPPHVQTGEQLCGRVIR